MEAFETLATKDYSPKQFLQYYINLWKRNVIARAIDVLCDEKTKALEGKDHVVELDGRPMTIGERVEARKILIQEAQDIVDAASELLALSDEDLAKRWTTDLAVAEDMLPPAAQAGDICYDGDNREGKLESDGQGGLICKVAETVTEAEPAPENTVEAIAGEEIKKDEAVVVEEGVATPAPEVEAVAVDPAPEAPSPEATV